MSPGERGTKRHRNGSGNLSMRQPRRAPLTEALRTHDTIWPEKRISCATGSPHASSGGVTFGSGTAMTLTPQDADAIARECPAVRACAPVVRARTQVIYGNRNWVPLYIYGTTPEFLDVRDWKDLAEGDAFSDRDVRNASKVCLIGQTLAWKQLVAAGYRLSTNPADAFFYLITAVHGLHVLGGLAALGRTGAKLRRGAGAAEMRVAVELCATYWHFLLAVWIALFCLLAYSPTFVWLYAVCTGSLG